MLSPVLGPVRVDDGGSIIPVQKPAVIPPFLDPVFPDLVSHRFGETGTGFRVRLRGELSAGGRSLGLAWLGHRSPMCGIQAEPTRSVW